MNTNLGQLIKPF